MQADVTDREERGIELAFVVTGALEQGEVQARLLQLLDVLGRQVGQHPLVLLATEDEAVDSLLSSQLPRRPPRWYWLKKVGRSFSRTRRNSTSTSGTFTETTGRPRLSLAGSTLPCEAKPTTGFSSPLNTFCFSSLPSRLPSAASRSAETTRLNSLPASTNG
ncbi:hypothetical protein G6F35_015508 [Rhizopus arrhizus]|nr:hypothetical protein G6F35_015508 [Rhizopus arrhizus]